MKRENLKKLFVFVCFLGMSGGLAGCGGDSPTDPIEEGNLFLELAPGVKMAFVHIEPGSFMMGTSDDDPYATRFTFPVEYPQHRRNSESGSVYHSGCGYWRCGKQRQHVNSGLQYYRLQPGCNGIESGNG